ncbi:MAG: TonB family protein [Gemmatimonadota bacterium]|nr:TonB family protein [Gemmatimonadota bacterium]
MHEPVLRISPPGGIRPDPGAPETENERFKRALSPAVRYGVLAAVAAHVILVALAPTFGAVEPTLLAAPRLTDIRIPPRVSIPPAPQPVARPARPDLATPAVARTLSVEAPSVAATLEPVSGAELAPPPVPAARAADRPPYIPFEVAPTLRNRERAATLLQQVYPASLRDSGVSGSVQLWIYIDDAGAVRDCLVAESSGYEELDLAAQTVAYAMVFTPARMRDRPTAVWISQPIDFIAR